MTQNRKTGNMEILDMEVQSTGADTAEAENTETQNNENQKTLEEAFEELETLAGRLEDEKTSLEDSFRLYKKGMELLKYCSGRLDTVEKKMLQMDEEGTLREF